MPSPLNVQRITLREIHLPLVESFRTSGGEVDARRILLLELVDGDGTTAWSECVAESKPTYAPDTVDSCWLAIEQWLAPRVVGRAIEGSGGYDLLVEGVRGHRMAIAAVEMGLWGLQATRERLPLAELVTRASRTGESPRRCVATGISLGIQKSEELLVARAREAIGAGYRRVKLKIEPGRDVVWIAAVREALGPTASLVADANSAYSLDDAAHVDALRALDAYGLAMIEQPLAHDDLRRHAALQKLIRTPICLDESITGLASAEDMLALDAGRIINIKPGRVGGFSQAIAIHDLCVDAGVPVWCGGMLESGIGRAYNVALAALPGFTQPGDISPSARYWAQDVVVPAWTMRDGALRVPLDRPGIGVEVNTGLIDDYTVRLAVVG